MIFSGISAISRTLSARRSEMERISARLGRLQDALLDGLIERRDYLSEKAKCLSRKKTIEEECAGLTSGTIAWLEPFKTWILAAKNMGFIAHAGSLPEKRGAAKEVFGSNLFFD